MKLYLGDTSTAIEVSYINTAYYMEPTAALSASFQLKNTVGIEEIISPLMGQNFEGFRVLGNDNETQIYSYSNLTFQINSLTDWCDESENRQITLTIQQIV